jgi:hypothetical protein
VTLFVSLPRREAVQLATILLLHAIKEILGLDDLANGTLGCF